MAYYIYENWQAGSHKAVVHLDYCPFCKHGRGLRGGSSPKHGKWHGPFATLLTAQRNQASMQVAVRIEHACTVDSSR